MKGRTEDTGFRILLVEDNPCDVERAREALHGFIADDHLHVVSRGTSALDFLYRQGEFPDAPRPDLIILDLFLPGMSGKEVLGKVKRDPYLRSIPVIAMTVSKDERDVLDCYRLRANCFITKPIDLDVFIKVFQSIRTFWFDVAKLPSRLPG